MMTLSQTQEVELWFMMTFEDAYAIRNSDELIIRIPRSIANMGVFVNYLNDKPDDFFEWHGSHKYIKINIDINV